MEKSFIVKFDDGREVDLVDLLTDTLNYWGEELLRIGVLDRYERRPPIPKPSTIFVERKDAKKNELELIQGVKMNHHFRFAEWNPELKMSHIWGPDDTTKIEVCKPKKQ